MKLFNFKWKKALDSIEDDELEEIEELDEEKEAIDTDDQELAEDNEALVIDDNLESENLYELVDDSSFDSKDEENLDSNYGTEFKLNSKLDSLSDELEEINLESEELLEVLNENLSIYDNIKDNALKLYNKLNLNKDEEVIKKEKGTLDTLAFDFENNLYYDGLVHNMGLIYKRSDDTLGSCKDNGIYKHRLIYSPAALCTSDFKRIDKDSAFIESMKKSISNVINDYSFKDNNHCFGMIPESIDIFNTQFRSCLNTNKTTILSVPKSVAVSHYLLPNKKSGDTMLIIDLDNIEPIFTMIRIKLLKNRKIVERCAILNKKCGLSTIKLMNLYLNEYKRKYKLDINDKEYIYLIDNKVLLNVLSLKKPVILYRDDSIISINYDEEVYKLAFNKFEKEISSLDTIVDDIKSKPGFEKLEVILLSSINVDLKYNNILSPAEAFEGFKHISSLLEKDPNAIIWQEKLPKLELEVINEKIHRFKYEKLINDDVATNIRFNMSSEQEIEVAHITLKAGKKDFYLPLKREIIFNDINRNKEAHFKHKSFPLENDMKVSLSVKVDYFSDNPIKLIARPIKGNNEFVECENEWIEPHTIEQYKGPTYSSHKLAFPDDFDESFFLDISSRLNGYLNSKNKESCVFESHAGLTYPAMLRRMHYAFRILRMAFDYRNINDIKLVRLCNSSEMSDFLGNVVKIYNDKDATDEYKNSLDEMLSDIIVMIDKINMSKNAEYIYERIVRKGNFKILTKLSRSIATKEMDKYGVFDKLSSMVLKNKNKFISWSFIRDLSQNCWFNENWISLFYNSIKGKEACNKIKMDLHDYLKKLPFVSNEKERNRKYRDLMEFFVCLTRVNNFDPNFLNPNNDLTRELLGLVKDSYEAALVIFRDESADMLKSRLESHTNQGELRGYQNYIYMLIMVLSGEGQVDLVGYNDD